MQKTKVQREPGNLQIWHCKTSWPLNTGSIARHLSDCEIPCTTDDCLGLVYGYWTQPNTTYLLWGRLLVWDQLLVWYAVSTDPNSPKATLTTWTATSICDQTVSVGSQLFALYLSVWILFYININLVYMYFKTHYF